jgi:hypothetical protein
MYSVPEARLKEKFLTRFYYLRQKREERGLLRKARLNREIAVLYRSAVPVFCNVSCSSRKGLM